MRSQLLTNGVLLLALSGASSLCDHASAQQAAPMPQTQAAKFLERWLAALNDGPSAISAFATANRVTSLSVDQAIFLWATTGGLSLIRIERSAQDSISALMQDNYSEQLERVEVSLNESRPKTATVSVRPTARPADLVIPRLTESAAVEALVARAIESARGDGCSGVLLVARGNRVLLERGWGEANRDTHIPIAVDTKFAIASTGKMFDAAAALQLVSAGKLRLDDTVGKYIPDYPNKDIASRVTVRHLLMHTGGTGGLPPDDVRKTLRTPDDYVRALSGRAPLFEPGTAYQYSNYGYILLADLIERTSRMSLQEYLQRRIFDPAGMRSTSIGTFGQHPPDAALPYSIRSSQMTQVLSNEPFPVYSTARDLLRFARLLESGRLISKALLAEATSAAGGRQYGYGLILEEHGPIKSFGHGGSSAGVNADVQIVSRLGYVVIGLSNRDLPAASRLVDFFLNRMPAS